MVDDRPLFIPVILGTTRQGRMSAHVALLMHEEVGKRPNVELKDQAFLPRIDKLLQELIWMAKTLRHGREHIPAESGT